MLGSGRAADLLRYLRGPSGIPAGRVDWFERRLRRDRVQTAAAALRLWDEKYEEPLEAVARLRESAGRPADLTAEVGSIAAAMGGRVGSDLEARTAAAIATAMAERAELDGLAPLPEALARALAGIRVRVWSGPVEDRVRIADPRRVRAARFDNVFVASLQDGEFPRGGAHTDPFLSERQRASLGLQPRHDSTAEERYLFHVCLALPKRRLFLSYRDSDENGGAEAPSPFLEDVRQMLEPIEGEVHGRGLAEVVHRVAEAPSETELARAIAARGPGADSGRLLEVAGAEGAIADRIGDRLASAAGAEAATRAPGPLSNPAVIAALGEVHAYGGTTLEGFDVCSYRWFVSHELAPQPLDPPPDPLVQGGIVHAVLYALYEERPGGDALPRPGSLPAWISRGRELVAEVATARELGEHPAERAMLARVEGLLARFLAEEARREMAGFEPWLLEAEFSESEEVEQPALEIDGWRLHGAIDRVDRAADGRALVLDYKLSSRVSPRVKLEEEAKLQLQLYLIAVAELWGTEIVGGLYHPLRATSERPATGAGARGPPPTWPDTGSPRPTGSTGRSSTRCSPTPAAAPARSSPACGPARSTATRARARACATTASARRSATSRRSAAATAPRSSRRAMTRRTSGEQASANGGAAGGDRGKGRRGHGRGGRRDRQDRRHGRPLLQAGLRAGHLPGCGPGLHLHRQGRGRAAPADPRRARAPGRGWVGARRASCCRDSAAPG